MLLRANFAPRSAVLLVLTLVLTGCGSDDYPKTIPVQGKVTLDGTPLAKARILFLPESGHQAIGEVVDGQYELRTFEKGDGAGPGKYRVTIKSVKIMGKNVPRPREEGGDSQSADPMVLEQEGETGQKWVKWITPRVYSDRRSTPLTAEVKIDEENQINFDLKSK